MKYVAVRVGSADDPRGVVRVSMALQSIAAQTQPAQRLIVTIALVSVLAAILLALGLALLWSRRIRRITETARVVSRGDLSAPIEVVGHDEVAILGRSLNEMRERLSRQLQTIDRQRRTLDSLVSQLREGVVVADGEGRIVLINSEAVELLQLSPAEPHRSYCGQTVEQCVPQHKLQNLLRGSGGNGGEIKIQELELKLVAGAEARSVLARAFDVRLPDAVGDGRLPRESAHIGRALVLTDVTELTRVMQMKADLAANASHELRTPLSAIRAALDTLRSVNWSSDAEVASQFIDVVDRHSGRMEAMIGDLLDLSRLESGKDRFEATPISAKSLLEELHSNFADALAAKSLHWETSLTGDDVTFMASLELLRMILCNLIDNAIRFTDPEGSIELSVCPEDGMVVFQVADTGCGMAAAEQQRVFERFYQVRRARSGPDRGTGLGLSIVRHAVSAMDGSLDLQSTIGHGTRVRVWVPRG
jgi:two-component system phosphate regulon sensor histidine kinase PhoR